MDEIYDVIIIGAGPAGLTAGLYCAQAGLSVMVIEKETMGGKIVNIDKIENYPGFGEGVSGPELGSQMMLQAVKYGLKFELIEVEGGDFEQKIKRIKTGGSDYLGKAVILGGGSRVKMLGVSGEEALIGKGVGYCALCDASQFANKPIIVCGGGDAGLTDALYLTKIASKITIVEAMPHLNAVSLLQQRAKENQKIEIQCNTTVEAILGEKKVEGVKLLNHKTQEQSELQIGGVLVRIGWIPETQFLQGKVPLDDQGNIMVNKDMATEVPGVFAAGDIRHGSPMQISTAVGDGTIAAISAQRYLREQADG